MALTDSDRLRALLGEEIPDGGDETDTLFTDEEISDLLSQYGTPTAAEGQGWKIKAGKLSYTVDIIEGSTARKGNQAFEHAMKMASSFGGVGAGKGPARVHLIQRP